jgi:class 3 adenylate cyclase/CheY-like chemotaxis protein
LTCDAWRVKKTAEKPLILVVDDTPENVDVLAGILKDEYHIKVALNGRKALEIARSDTPPDLILLDVMMPEMDGYEVCSRLQAEPETRDIPVIFVTAKTGVEDEARGFELGAVDYIAKPVSPSIVQARVNTHISLKQAHSSLKGLSDKLSRYLSPQIYQSIFEGKQDASIGSSRKKLSVFFSDIVGFTRKTDGLEPEDLSYILNSYLNRMAEVVISHGGTLDKFIGDAILTFFGDPETRGPEGDALACLEMAMDMREAVTLLNKEWERLAIPTGFQIRMGITTGFCTVGNFGSEQRMDYTIIGNQVNLASRLESVSQPGELRIAHETWLLVRDHYDCTPQDPILVKGFERPIQTYIVNGPRNADDQNGRIEESCDGFSLALNPEQINSEDREAVLDKLQAAIDKMR